MNASLTSARRIRALSWTALFCLTGACLSCHQAKRTVDPAARVHILDLLKRGQLEDARRAIESLGDPALPDNADLWAKYHLQVVIHNPLSGATIDAARSIASDRAEFVTAKDFIHQSIELSVQSAGGATAISTLAAQMARAEAALWHGDGGHELKVLLSLARAERCSNENEWPCMQSELETLSGLGARSQAEQLRASAELRLRSQAESAQLCGQRSDAACFDRAIERWTRWEAFTGRHAPELPRLRNQRSKALHLRGDRPSSLPSM